MAEEAIAKSLIETKSCVITCHFYAYVAYANASLCRCQLWCISPLSAADGNREHQYLAGCWYVKPIWKRDNVLTGDFLPLKPAAAAAQNRRTGLVTS